MAAGDFRWNDDNVEHARKHGCMIAEIESAVSNPERGYPRKVGSGKFQVVGRGGTGKRMEVIFVRDEDGTMYIIHAQQVSTRRRRRR